MESMLLGLAVLMAILVAFICTRLAALRRAVERARREVEARLHDEGAAAAARRALNAAISRYNSSIESFPAVIFAAMLRFRPAEFHQAECHFMEDGGGETPARIPATGS